jgi:nucleotide-binding universal stress UspA family protein
LYNCDLHHFRGLPFALVYIAVNANSEEGVLQYTIETRALTNESTHRRRDVPGSVRTVVVAKDPDEAIHQYVRQSDAELVSFTEPGHGRESIATVKKEDVVFLVRVYE